MNNLVQMELDMVEEHLLTCLFRDANNPQFNSTAKSFFVMSGKDPIAMINSSITQFETAVRPFLKENGYVDGEKLSRLIAVKFNKQVPIGDFRLIDATRMIEPWLVSLGALIQ